MRRFVPFLAGIALALTPLAASAAFQTPGGLYQSIQSEEGAHSFTLTAHGGSNGTYLSLWSSGTEHRGPEDTMKLTMKATVDIAHDGLTARLKGTVIIVDSMLYLKIDSVSGNEKKALGLLAELSGQKHWIALPADNNILTGITGTDIGMLSSTDPAAADTMFLMTSSPGKYGTTYSLALTQDFASTVAQKLLLTLGDNAGSSTDFFPWRELAETVTFDMTVSTNTKDVFVASAYNLSMSGKQSYFRANGTEKALSSPPAIVAPSDADTITIADLFSAFGDLTGQLPTGAMELMDSNGSASSSSPAPMASECTDGTASGPRLLMLQRLGACSVLKVPTRIGGW